MGFISKVKSEVFKKLYFKQWVIGLSHNDIKDVIRKKDFNQDINWLALDSFDHFYADPFFLNSNDGSLHIIFEDFSIDDFYGNISLMTLDKSFNKLNQKILLDTKYHLSYPFNFIENDRIYVFPESARQGKLSCYEFDPEHRTLNFIKDIIHLPLYDSTIVKLKDKYWLFGITNENREGYKLYLFYSKSLLGPYISHPDNPVKSGLNGTRPAGNFIDVDGIIYRPTQNCQKRYGESVTICRINEISEFKYIEEPYMTICINEKNRHTHGIYEMHTINSIDDFIVVDGMRWKFSLKDQWENFLRNRRLLRQFEKEKN